MSPSRLSLTQLWVVMVIWPFLSLHSLFSVSCVMIDRLIALWRILILSNFHCSVYSHLISTEEFPCSVFQVHWFCSVPFYNTYCNSLCTENFNKNAIMLTHSCMFCIGYSVSDSYSCRIRVERMFSALVLEEWNLNLVSYFAIISIFYCIAVF